MIQISSEAQGLLDKIHRAMKDADMLSDYWQDWGQRKVDFLLSVSATIQDQGRVSKKQKEIVNEIHIQIGEKVR